MSVLHTSMPSGMERSTADSRVGPADCGRGSAQSAPFCWRKESTSENKPLPVVEATQFREPVPPAHPFGRRNPLIHPTGFGDNSVSDKPGYMPSYRPMIDPYCCQCSTQSLRISKNISLSV